MAKNTPLIKVTCPCCQAELHIDSETSAVIRHVEHVKPPTFADLESAHDVLSKKFDEMLKIAKENPDEPPPKRDIDFD